MSSAIKGPCDEGVILAKRELAPCEKSARRWILAATILGSSITFIDGTVVNVALPTFQRELGATVSQAQWIIEAYALLLASLLLTGGALGDRYGRRRVFMIGVAVFAAASAWCGVSAGVDQLIAARALQGVGAALLVPGSLAIISASFSKEERGQAIGVWSGFSALAAGAGPVIGGWLIEHVSWRWIFFLNLPLAAIVILIASLRVPESRVSNSGPLDIAGSLLATVGLGGLVFGLIEWNTAHPSNALVISGIAIGFAALAAFIRVESRSATPMMPLGLFRSKSFAGANLLTLLLYGGLGGLLFFLPFNLIQVQGYSAVAAGASLLPFVLVMFLLSGTAGGLVEKTGPKLPLVVGPALTAAGFALFAMPGADAGSYWTSFFPPILVMSLGMTASVAPLTTTVMGSVDQKFAGIASGINNAVSRTAALLAIAVLGLIMVRGFEADLMGRLAALQIPTEARAEIAARVGDLAAMEIPASATQEQKTAIAQAVEQAFVAGFRCVAYVAAGLAATSALVAAWLIEGRPLPSEEY